MGDGFWVEEFVLSFQRELDTNDTDPRGSLETYGYFPLSDDDCSIFASHSHSSHSRTRDGLESIFWEKNQLLASPWEADD